MKTRIQFDCKDIDFAEVARILQIAGMAYHPAELHRTAFENSAVKLFLLDASSRLIGFGRAISDGAYQAALYDIAVVPQYQGEGFGKMITEELLKKLPGIQVMLYAKPGKESFYQKFGFRKMRTAMALVKDPDGMAAKGIIEND
jgi:ribosomal protein S18 acetylase RimI-like enzyme